jgi:hypothetical protein
VNEHPYFCVQNPAPGGTKGVFVVHHLVVGKVHGSDESQFRLEHAIPENHFGSIPEAEDFFLKFMVQHAHRYGGEPINKEEGIPFVLNASSLRIATISKRGKGNVIITHGGTAPLHLIRRKLLGDPIYQSDIIPPYHALVLYKGHNQYDGAAVVSAQDNDVWLSVNPRAATYGVLVDLTVATHPE